jgi:hypothetical protein
MQVKNLQYNEVNAINCEVEHPQFGWIPFTASPDDVEQMGRDIYAQAVAGDYGPVATYAPPQKEEADADKANQVRAERNAKLAETDWTQLVDSPVDHAAWFAYRQALRDITAQEGFPWTIDWPTQP